MLGRSKMEQQLIRAIGLIVCFSLGCSPPIVDTSSKKSVNENDLLGAWEIEYAGRVINGKEINGTEAIIFKEGGRYEQKFDDEKMGDQPVIALAWKLTRRDYDDRQLIVLHGMRRYWEDREPILLSTSPQETRLEVQVNPKLPLGISKEEIVLCFEDPDLSLCFKRSDLPDKK